MAHMDKVRQHLGESAAAHKKHQADAIREAAIAKAWADAGQTPDVPQTGLQGPDGGYWEAGDEG